MSRPAHLPDFTEPPLDEVVVGVQFAPIPMYTSVHSWKVWELFRDEFSAIEEQPLLEPYFETFGGTNVQRSIQVRVGAPPMGCRLWFISSDESHLLQFQPDRFLMNWRKRPTRRAYPRFEGMATAFEQNLRVLSGHLATAFSYQMDVNQAEVTYINIVPVTDFSEAGDWFRLWNGGDLNVESLNTSFSEVVLNGDGKPFARLKHELQSVVSSEGGQKAFRLSLRYRGRPAGNDVESAMDFLAAGREAVVTRFAEITTSKAHQAWGRQQ